MKKYNRLLEIVLEKYQIVKFTDSNYILEDGSRVSRPKFREQIFKAEGASEEFLEDPRFIEYYKDLNTENRRKVKQRFFEDLEQIVKDTINAKVSGVDKGQLKSSGIVENSFDFSEFCLFRNMTTGRYQGQRVLYDLSDSRITEINPEIYIDSLDADTRARFKPLDAIFEYDPYDIRPITSTEYLRQEINRVNTYVAPYWRKIDTPVSDKLPPIFHKYLKHLFPDKESLRFTLSWIRNLILFRPETILILNGAKGIGKNILVDFAKELVGSENFGRGKDTLFKKEFDAILEDKRLIFFDEMRFHKKEHTKFKDICNAEQNIEKKGVDANNLTPTFFGMIINSNDGADVYLEYNDRRFSPVNLTQTPLSRVFSKQEIQELIALMEDPLAIKRIGQFIINYKHDVYSDPFHVFKTEKFHSLVYTSLHGWQQYIMDKLLKEDYESTDITFIREDAQDAGVKFPATKTKIENFLQNYIHRGEFKVGFLKLEKRSLKLYKHDELIEYTQSNTSSIGADDI